MTAAVRSRWIPGLDGLRAIAVLLVALHHFDTVRWFPGGFVGVDLFFVLSGFLVTTLLLDERDRTGQVALGRFWARRALRLLPAVVVVVGVVVLAVLALQVTAPDHAPPLDPLVPTAVTGLFYVGNWLPATGRPFDLSLGHLWSLGIEEQFYVVWPLLVVAVFAAGASRRVLGLVALTLAGASAAVPVIGSNDDWTRWYFGTDSRIQALLLGAALATTELSQVGSPSALRAIRVAGVTGVVVLGVATGMVHTDHLWFYRGLGLTVVALAAAAVVAAVVTAACSRSVALLEHPALSWVGRRSYGIYLIRTSR